MHSGLGNTIPKTMFARAPTRFATVLTLCLASLAIAQAADDSGLHEIFTDFFADAALAPAWEVHEGEWSVVEGALVCRNGGLISLKSPPGGRFVLEFEIAFPSNWMSVIPLFTSPENYATLYFGGGYWESFEMLGTEIADYVQRKDDEIVRTGGFQKIRLVAEYGVVSFSYDGKEKGPAVLSFRPGARVAFRSLPNSGPLKIRRFRLLQMDANKPTHSEPVAPEVLAGGMMHEDHDLNEQEIPRQELALDTPSGTGTIDYDFSRDAVFQSRFVRIPLNIGQSDMILLDLHGDNSGNNVFVIVHDASGEQHLALLTGLAWSGWQDVGVNLQPLLASPGQYERQAIHWDGDRNQRVDFPITALDLGVVKRDGRTRDRGRVQFRRIRFEK